MVVRGEADNNPATGAPSITGAAREGVALAAGVADISDTDGLTGVSYAYQWEREDGGAWGAITGATAQHYYVSAADVGKTIRVVVRFTDDADNAESASERRHRCGHGRGDHQRGLVGHPDRGQGRRQVPVQRRNRRHGRMEG